MATEGVLGAVLVGGASRRMGSPKSLLEVDGVAMARRVANAMTAAGCARVVAIGPTALTAGLEPVDDLYPGEGPLGGIITALRAAQSGTTLVVACDLPWIDAGSLGRLLSVPASGLDVVAAHTSRLEPLCAWWQPTAAPLLRAAFEAGERAVHRAMDSLEVCEVELPDDVLINVNTPDDLRSE